MAQQIGLQAILDLGQYSKNVQKYLDGLDRMGKATGKFDDQASGFGAQATKSFQGLGKAVLAAGVVIATATVAAGAAIGAFTISGIKKAADLESQMSRIAATLNTTREQIAPLKDLIMDLALDPKLVVTTNEAADAVENLAKNGLSMQQILDGAAKSVVLLANATGAEFGAAADVVTDIMAQFNIKAEDTQHVVDQVTAVTNLSKLTFEDYALAIAQAGGAAGTFGVGFEDFNAVLITTNANFASGSDLGTSYKNFLTTLPGKSDKAKEAIKALGLEFFDANGQMKTMPEIAEELNQAFLDEVTFTSQVNNMTAEQTAQKKLLEQQLQRTGGQLFLYQAGVNGVGESEEANAEAVAKLNQQHDAAMTAYEGLATSMGTTVTVRRKLTDEERIAYAQTIFGVDSMRLAMGLAEAGAVAYTDMATATKALGLEGKQLEVAQKSLTESFKDGEITFIEFAAAQAAAMDAEAQAAERMRNFKGVLDILQGAIEGLQIMIGDAFLPILTVLANKANELVAAYGPSLVKPFQDFGAALTEFFASLEAGQTPLNAFRDAMATFGPKGTEVANAMIAVGAAIGGVFVAIGMILSPITAVIGSFVEWKDVAIVLGIAVGTVLVPAIYSLLAAMAPITLIIGGAILAVAGLRTAWENDWLGIQTKTTEAVSAIQAAFEPFTEAVRTHMQGALTEVQTFASGNETEFTNVKAIWEGLKTSVEGIFTSIVETVRGYLPAWTGTLTEWGMAATLWILNAAAQIGTYISSYTTTLLTEIGNKLPEWTTKLTEWSTAAGAWLATASAEVGAKLGEWYTALSTELGNKLKTWQSAFPEWITAAGKWLTTAASEIVTKLGEWYTALSTALSGKLASWMTAFNDWTEEAWNWIVTAAGLVSAKIGEWYTALSTAVSAKLTTWKTAFVEWAKELYDWIKDSFPFITTQISAWYTKLSGDVSAKLTTFKTEMLKWATELVAWIGDKAADALPHLGTWLGKILAWTPTGAVLLATGMLKLATSLISWIGDKAADALPHLGTWLGKILGWIIGTAVPGLVVGVVALAKALVGWITGTGGVAVEDSAQGKLAAEFEKFKTALGTAITKMWEGIKGFVKNFGQSFYDELGKNIDWNQLGTDIITTIWTGIDTMKALITGTFQFIAQEAYNFIFNTDWLGLGTTVITNIKTGVESLIDDTLTVFGDLAANAVKKFTKIDWEQLGKDIIGGIKKGLEAVGGEIVDYIVGLGEQALDQIKAFFGIESPSKVMMEVGMDIVRGLIKGIDEQQTRLKRSVGRMTSNILDTIIRGSERVTDALSNIAGNFASVGSGWVDTLKTNIDSLIAQLGTLGISKYAPMQVSVIGYEAQKRNLDMLKQQSDLINLIRESGGNPSEILAGISLGIGADPKQLLDAVTRTMAVLNAQLDQSVRAAASMLPEYINKLRANRRSIEDVEATFIATHLDQRERYAQGLAKIDTQIARLEQDLLTTGNKALKPMIEALDVDRKKIITGLQTYLEQTRLLEKAFAGLKNLTGPGQTSAQQFVDEQIQPILDAFAAPMGETERAAWVQAVQTRVMAVNGFIDQMREVERLQQRVGSNNAFGDLTDLFTVVTDIATPEASRTRLIGTLTVYINQMERLFALQQDLSVGTQADPLVARFKTERLDAIEQQLKNINLSEAERARLIEQYRIEQEKILAIQQKQSQLNFLKEQLDLLNQAKDLAEKFPALVNVKDIFAGVQLGATASIDSLLAVVSKMIDAVIRTTNKELGIASPSKVFEQIGQYMMGGLARGIESSVMRPINSLSGAISELPYSLGGRSLTLNMGGVTISNGMDEAMFEARVRQILDRAFP